MSSQRKKEVKNPYSSDNKRVREFFEGINLGTHTVTIIGLGGGGEIALHLLRSGIQKLNLIDFDILEEGNLVRHVCGSKYIGKNKAQAVKELLDEYSGYSNKNIKAFNWNIFDEYEKFSKIIKSSDVVVVATDSDSSRYFANEICNDHNVPAVFVSMLEKGCGGEVFTFKPGFACLECTGHIVDRTDFLEKYQKATVKKDCSSARDVTGMPGLGIDQAFFCAITSRKVLDIILEKKKKHSLEPIGKNWIIFSNYGIKDVLEGSLSSKQASFPSHPNCRLCNAR